jgi:hypothetical protein
MRASGSVISLRELMLHYMPLQMKAGCTESISSRLQMNNYAIALREYRPGNSIHPTEERFLLIILPALAITESSYYVCCHYHSPLKYFH